MVSEKINHPYLTAIRRTDLSVPTRYIHTPVSVCSMDDIENTIQLITKAINIAKTARDDLGSYIAIGIAGIFFFHMAENIGMTIGLLPITGVPLPFVSYGGSSMITNFIGLGLLLSVSAKRNKKMFE